MIASPSKLAQAYPCFAVDLAMSSLKPTEMRDWCSELCVTSRLVSVETQGATVIGNVWTFDDGSSVMLAKDSLGWFGHFYAPGGKRIFSI